VGGFNVARPLVEDPLISATKNLENGFLPSIQLGNSATRDEEIRQGIVCILQEPAGRSPFFHRPRNFQAVLDWIPTDEAKVQQEASFLLFLLG
jgi:hypothetical protein